MKLRKKMTLTLIFLLITVIMFGFVGEYQRDNTKINLSFQIKSNISGNYQLFHTTNATEGWSEEKSSYVHYVTTDEWQTMNYTIPKKTVKLRLDFGSEITFLEMKNLTFTGNTTQTVNLSGLEYEENQLSSSIKNETMVLKSLSNDPFIAFSAQPNINEALKGISPLKLVLKIIISVLLSFLMTFIINSAKEITRFLKDILSGRHMIMSLGKNDFKTKYASSYLGITWGFIQPLMTITTYWFVFQVGLRSGNVSDTPFILWFLVAIVPWFFFSEAFSGATNVFSEYSYLVKKVVFKIELLPMVKITSAFFVHVFFLLFIFIIYSIYGYYPSLYNFQVIYYVFCSVVLVISLSILSSALVLFFKDLNQIIIIILQIGFWFTPIGWSYTMLPSSWAYIFKLNPMMYIVEGFRDTFISHIAFYNHPYYTFYFWLFCLVALSVGIKTFGRLKPHFADVI